MDQELARTKAALRRLNLVEYDQGLTIGQHKVRDVLREKLARIQAAEELYGEDEATGHYSLTEQPQTLAWLAGGVAVAAAAWWWYRRNKDDVRGEDEDVYTGESSYLDAIDVLGAE